jgi:hypothetical protein
MRISSWKVVVYAISAQRSHGAAVDVAHGPGGQHGGRQLRHRHGVRHRGRRELVVFIAAPILLSLGEGRLRPARAPAQPRSPPRVVQPYGTAS